MLNFLNLHNYRDKTYRYIMFTCLILMILIGDILTPILNYIAVSLPKNSHQFNNYATIASIAPGLPFMFSILISYIINSFAYNRLVFTVFIIATLITLLMFKLNLTNFILLTIAIVIISFLYRAIYFSLDRQLSTILVDRIHDFQSDLAIWGGIIGALNMKFSGYLYTHYQLNGILWCFLLGNAILFYCAKQIPPIIQIEKVIVKQNCNSVYKKPNLVAIGKTLSQNPALIQYIFIIFLIMMLGGSLNILLMSKMHHDQAQIEYYASLMSLSMVIGIFGAMAGKFKWLKLLPAHKLVALSVGLSSLCIIGLGISNSTIGFAIFYLGSIAVSSITFINVNSILFRHIRQNDELIKISPFINGVVGSLFYGASLIGQLITNTALNHNLNYQNIYIIVGVSDIILASLLFYLKNQPAN